MRADEAKEFLSNLSVAERIAAVAEDVESDEQRFASIAAHDLAELLGVPQPEQPDDSWSRTTYAERQTLEEYVDLDNSIVEEFPDRLPSKTTPERVQSVRALCEDFVAGKRESLDFLTAKERACILEQLDEKRLQSQVDNGIGCVATYSVSNDHTELWFEGDIEDDGSCIDLRGPYDGADGSGRDPLEWISLDW